MFMGRKYQQRVKNSLNTPSTAAVAFASFIVLTVVLDVLHAANNHGHFSGLMRLRYRAILYPAFFLIYFINWRIWRSVTQPENKLGADSRELAERLPFWSILVVAGISFAIFLLVRAFSR